jgi:hypothetical protein
MGFFGQNFAWMVTRITSLPIFLSAGIGLPVAVAVASSPCSAVAAGSHPTALCRQLYPRTGHI